MALTRFVKVGKISNLSDARYCAGMGVDLLGFRTVSGQENFIAPKQFQEVRGWITGPRVVAEIYGLQDAGEIDSMLESYRPDLIELSLTELDKINESPVPLILRCSTTHVTAILSHRLRPKIDYLLIDDFKNEGKVISEIPVLVELNQFSLDEIKPEYSGYGIALNGSAEVRPGLKSYEDLADILEKLDAD
jgi:phosphoribosylanthranilate isomerase